MRRAASSVASNIAEGSVRKSNNDKARLIEIAYGSLMELMSQLIESFQMDYFKETELAGFRLKVRELSNKINAFYNRLKK